MPAPRVQSRDAQTVCPPRMAPCSSVRTAARVWASSMASGSLVSTVHPHACPPVTTQCEMLSGEQGPPM